LSPKEDLQMISNQRIVIAWSCLASLLQVTVSFSTPARTSFIPTTRVATKRYSTTKDNSSSVTGDDARKEKWASLAGSDSERFLVDAASFLDEPPFTNNVAKDLVVAAMMDPTVTDSINGKGIVTDLPIKDGLMASSDTTVSAFLSATDEETTKDAEATTSETVNAILVAAEVAAAAAEAKLFKKESEIIPLIPRSSNDTIDVAVQLEPPFVPASQVVGEPITAVVPVEIETPNVKKILKFAIPAIGVWLCGPLLSLIDTSVVGLFSGTFQQAALNPAVAVTDYAALLIVCIFRHFFVDTAFPCVQQC
jgi:hypothetical protein